MRPWWQWSKTSWRFSFFLAIIGFVSLLKKVLCLFLLISKRSWDKFRVNFTCFSRFYVYYVGIIQRDAEPSPKSPYVLSNIRPTTNHHHQHPALFKACMWGEKFATIYLCLCKVPLKFMSSHKQEGVETAAAAAAALHNVPWCWCYLPTNWLVVSIWVMRQGQIEITTFIFL